MEEKQLNELARENERLTHLATHDELTGILNRRAVEQAISETMTAGGALLVCDLDRFKSINDRYGHLTGDQCLIKTAHFLRSSTRGSDVVGRIGGDEFVVFMYGVKDQEQADKLVHSLEQRLIDQTEDTSVPLSISIAASMYMPDDTYQTLFDRADQKLLAIKKRKKSETPSASTEEILWSHDIQYIVNDFTENPMEPGAYCRDYESFKSIYHFLSRTMKRTGHQCTLIVFSLTDQNHEVLPPAVNGEEMALLGHILKSNLRLGDVYTRYTSNQYLVLLACTDETQSLTMACRIRMLYEENGTAVFNQYSIPLSGC